MSYFPFKNLNFSNSFWKKIQISLRFVVDIEDVWQIVCVWLADEAASFFREAEFLVQMVQMNHSGTGWGRTAGNNTNWSLL